MLDFALATKTDVASYFLPKCGTPGYIAPEIANLKDKETSKYSSACDLFSIGCVMYKM
jgi:serine/threonine protein kinase